jgi:phosphate transport system protein
MAIMQKEMESLKKKILAEGAVVEESVQKAVRALLTRDVRLAEQVVADDLRIDQMEVEYEEDGLKVLALHQPVAIDLRFIVSTLRINSDLERIGDLAVNIAERAAYLAGQPRIELPMDYAGMAEKTQAMVKKSLDALVSLDSGLAREVMAADDEVDHMNRRMYEDIQAEMARRPADIQPLMHMLSCSRHLERIADHATNIAEDVIYMVQGEIVRHKAEDFLAVGD